MISELTDIFLTELGFKLAEGSEQEIDKTDKEIDRMVYDLYGLSEEEKSVIENS